MRLQYRAKLVAKGINKDCKWYQCKPTIPKEVFDALELGVVYTVHFKRAKDQTDPG